MLSMFNGLPSTPGLLTMVILSGIAVLCLMLACMPALIRYLRKLKYGQTEREEGLESHKAKSGTPTMGGIAFVLIPVLVYLVYYAFFRPFGWTINTAIVLLAYVGYGLIGFADDYLIVVQHSNIGLKPKLKFGLQSILALVLIALYLMYNEPAFYLHNLSFAVLPTWLFVIIAFFMFTGTTNAVNLSDGVDGLCAGLCIAAFIPFLCFAVWMNDLNTALILFLVICALIGYLFFNIHPAKVFMGDTGSLALGGLLAAAAMVTQTELYLLIAGIVFIAEALSDIIQVTYYKKTRKRIFLMAPLHHHFEKKGWSEMKVCYVFWGYGMAAGALSILLAILH